MPIYIVSDSCDGPTLNYAYTDNDGEYFIGTLAPGEVYVMAPAQFASSELSENYIRAWFDDALSCEEADSVLVETGIDTGETNFFLYDSTDSDGDGMPDQWEINYFRDTSRNGHGDFNGDGTTDFEEYELGYNPCSIGNTDVSGILEDAPAYEVENNESDTNSSGSGSGGGCFISTAILK